MISAAGAAYLLQDGAPCRVRKLNWLLIGRDLKEDASPYRQSLKVQIDAKAVARRFVPFVLF